MDVVAYSVVFARWFVDLYTGALWLVQVVVVFALDYLTSVVLGDGCVQGSLLRVLVAAKSWELCRPRLPNHFHRDMCFQEVCRCGGCHCWVLPLPYEGVVQNVALVWCWVGVRLMYVYCLVCPWGGLPEEIHLTLFLVVLIRAYGKWFCMKDLQLLRSNCGFPPPVSFKRKGTADSISLGTHYLQGSDRCYAMV